MDADTVRGSPTGTDEWRPAPPLDAFDELLLALQILQDGAATDPGANEWLRALAGRHDVPLPDLGHAAADRLEQIGGTACRSGPGIQWLPLVWHPFAGDPPPERPAPAPRARVTCYHPGEHELAFTADECDQILEAVTARPAHRHDEGAAGACKLDILRCFDDDGPLDDVAWLGGRLAGLFGAANSAWFRLDVTSVPGWHVCRYRPGDRYTRHLDNAQFLMDRKLSVVVLLTEPAGYEGGELHLQWQDECWPARLERGSAVVFPSSTLHHVTPVTSGERATLAAWAHGPELR